MPAPAARVFTGADHYPATGDAISVGVVGLIAIPLVKTLGWSVPLLLLATALVAALAAGARFRLTVSPAGIELLSLRVWVLPVRRETWLLDAKIDLYEPLDADAPQGLYVVEPGGVLGKRSDCFGPAREGRVRALQAETSAALEEQRAAVPPCPLELRHARLGPQSARLDVGAATRHPSGRLREVASIACVDLGGIEIPPGSVFLFNEEPFVDPRFIDPRRDDVLVEVRVARPVVVYGRATNAGAVLRYGDRDLPFVIREAFDREVEIDGRMVRGDDNLVFRPDGRLNSFTLARELQVGDLALPAGSKLWLCEGSRYLPARWTCWLGAPLPLPETTLAEGERCTLSPDLSRLTEISPHRDFEVPQGLVRASVLPVPVKPDGRIDVRAARKTGALLRTKPPWRR